MSRLVVEEDTVYEVDEECLCRKTQNRDDYNKNSTAVETENAAKEYITCAPCFPG